MSLDGGFGCCCCLCLHRKKENQRMKTAFQQQPTRGNTMPCNYSNNDHLDDEDFNGQPTTTSINRLYHSLSLLYNSQQQQESENVRFFPSLIF